MSPVPELGPSGLLGLPCEDQNAKSPDDDSRCTRFTSILCSDPTNIDQVIRRPRMSSACSSEDAPLGTPRTRAVSVRWDIGDGHSSDDVPVRESRLSAFSMHLAKYVLLSPLQSRLSYFQSRHDLPAGMIWHTLMFYQASLELELQLRFGQPNIVSRRRLPRSRFSCRPEATRYMMQQPNLSVQCEALPHMPWNIALWLSWMVSLLW